MYKLSSFVLLLEYRDRLLRVVRGACDDRHISSLLSIIEDWIKNQCIASPHTSILSNLNFQVLINIFFAILSKVRIFFFITYLSFAYFF